MLRVKISRAELEEMFPKRDIEIEYPAAWPELKQTEWSDYDQGWNDAIRACEMILEESRR